MKKSVLVTALSVFAVAVLLVGPAALAAQETTPRRSGGAEEAERPVDGAVAGRVLSAVGREPIEGASVTAWRDGRLVAVAETGPRGRYRLGELPAGRLLVRVVTADHAAHEVAVEIGSGPPLQLDLVLALDPPVLPPIHAEGERLALAPGARGAGEAPDADAGRPADPGLRSRETGPGAGLPGAGVPGRPGPPPSEPGGALYVRGGASDLKRVHLDGAPVYTPFHLGGLMEAAPDGVLRSATLYTGGAPLAYDGGLSYVLDLRTRAGGPDERAGGRLDLMGGSLRAEGGGEHASWLVSGRRSHVGAADWLAEGELPYGYVEALGRMDLRLSERHRLAVTGFVNEELARLGSSLGTGAGTAADGGSDVAPTGEAARWGNEAVSLRYRGAYGDTEIHATAAVSGFTTTLPVSTERDRLARSETGHTRVALDATTLFGGLSLAYGAAFEGRRLHLRLPAGDEEDGLLWHGRGGALSVYGGATLRAGDAVSLGGGLRARGFGAEEGIRLGPRLSVTLRGSDATRLVLSAGRSHQRLGAPESVLSSDLDLWADALRREAAEGFPDGGAGFPALAVASASHLSVRLDHRPEDGPTLGLEGYLKTFDELAAGDDLHASGADVWIDWSGDGWRAWGGYSLGWAWSDAPPDSTARGFTGRQLVSVGAEADLPSGVRLSAEVRASSGLPFTRLPVVPDAGGGAPTEPTPPGPGGTPPDDLGLAGPPEGSYLRLDLSVSRSWSLDVMGRSTVLRPYLRVLNALDRRDALFYHFDPSGRLTPRALDTVPLVPVLGVAWEVS